MIKNYLYGKNGDQHKEFNHIKLNELLNNEEDWVLSYNNSEEVLDLYSKYHILYPNWKYGMSKDKDSKEVLILSENIKKLLIKKNKL